MSFIIDPYEEKLIQGCIKNDRVLQKELYDKYKDGMYTIAYRIVNDFDEASDVLQDAFLKVFKNINGFKKESTLGAWIKTIVVRTAISKLKTLRLFESLNVEVHDDVIEWDENLTGKQLEKAIQALPGSSRSVFILTEVEGYSHKEVAEILQISEGTSKSQLFYAKKLLQNKLRSLVE